MLALQRVGPGRPRLVVITMTPFAASAPYMVAASGPLNTSIFSMMLGSIWSNGDGAGDGAYVAELTAPPTITGGARLVRFPLRASDCAAYIRTLSTNTTGSLLRKALPSPRRRSRAGSPG